MRESEQVKERGVRSPEEYVAEFIQNFEHDEKVPRIDLTNIDPSSHQKVALLLIGQGYRNLCKSPFPAETRYFPCLLRQDSLPILSHTASSSFLASREK